MTKVYCDQCGKFLFETELPEDNRGGIASRATTKGFIAKLPFLYGINTFKLFCSKECNNLWMDSHISPDKKETGDKALKAIKEGIYIDKCQRDLQEGVSKIENILDVKRKNANNDFKAISRHKGIKVGDRIRIINKKDGFGVVESIIDYGTHVCFFVNIGLPLKMPLKREWIELVK